MQFLIGSWDLVSSYVQRSDGSRHHYFGEHPRGRLTYTGDGKVHAILTAESRPNAGQGKPGDAEKIVLYDTSLAYTGTYIVEGSQVTHRIEVSTHEDWVGKDMIRYYTFDGDRLHILTAPALDPKGEETVTYVVEWTRSPIQERSTSPSPALHRVDIAANRPGSW
jgi:hypothetical protein